MNPLSSVRLNLPSFLVPNPVTLSMKADCYVANPVTDLRVEFITPRTRISSDEADDNIWFPFDFPRLELPGEREITGKGSGFELFPNPSTNLIRRHVTTPGLKTRV